MESCLICGGSTGIFSAKCASGQPLCKTCMSALTPLMRSSVTNMQPPSVSQCLRYIDKKNNSSELSFDFVSAFRATDSLGELHIDAVNTLFCVCSHKNLRKDGSLKNDPGDIYPLLWVDDFNLDIKKGSDFNTTFSGPVVLTVKMSRPSFSFSVIVKKSERYLTEINGDYITYSLPPSVVLMRNKMINIINAERDAVRERLENEFYTDEKRGYQEYNDPMREETQSSAVAGASRSAYADALALFMLNDDYTIAELRRQRNILLKAFHPDAGNTSAKGYTERILEAYTLLEEHLTTR